MPYAEYDESGRIVCLYNALDPMFQQARTYLSTDKLQERLDEYPAVHEEAARLGVSFDEAVGHRDDKGNPEKAWTICGRWPDWLEDAELGQIHPAYPQDNENEPGSDTAPQSIADSVHDETPDEPGSLEMGLDQPADDFAGDTGVDGDVASEFDQELLEADPDVSEPADSAGPDYGGQGVDGETIYSGMGSDPLGAAKAMKLLTATEKEREWRQYFEGNLRHEHNRLTNLVMLFREDKGPQPSDSEMDEWHRLQRADKLIGANADRLRNEILDAHDFVTLDQIDLRTGWPE